MPLTIRFGDQEFVDRVELSADEFWERLERSDTLPETAAPSPGAFETCFRDLAARGATGIVCINLSSHLSGTMQSAQVAAAATVDVCPVQVIDSQSASMGQGNLCLTAARRAADGDSLESIVAEVVDRRDRTKLFATLDTLEFLKKGGRVGNARALVGTMLSIKPVIELQRRCRRGDRQGPYPLEGVAHARGQGEPRRRSSTWRCCTATRPTSTSSSTSSRRSSPATRSSPA